MATREADRPRRTPARRAVRPLILAGDRLLTGRRARRHVPVRRPRGRAASRWATRTSSSARSAAAEAAARRGRRAAAVPPRRDPARAADLVAERAEELARADDARDRQRDLGDAARGAPRRPRSCARAAEEARRIIGEQIPIDAWPNGEGRYAMTRRFPVGPVLGDHAVQRAAAARRAQARAGARRRLPCIIRPASKTPLSALSLGEIIARGRRAAGRRQRRPVPDRARRAPWRATSASRRSRSPAAARSAGTCAASRAPHRITLELGGNGAVIVHADADVGLRRQALRLRRLPARRAGLHLRAAPVRRTRRSPRRSEPRSSAQIEEHARSATRCDDATIDRLPRRRARRRRRDGASSRRRARPARARRSAAAAASADAGRADAARRRPDDRARLRRGGLRADRGHRHRTTTWTPRSPPPATRRTACRRASSRTICESSSAPIQQLEVGGVIVNDVNTFRVDHMPYGGERRSGCRPRRRALRHPRLHRRSACWWWIRDDRAERQPPEGGIRLEHVSKVYGNGFRAVNGHRPGHRRGRVHGPRRPVRLRQVDAAAHDRRARGGQRRARSRSAAATSPTPRRARATSRWCSRTTRSTRT